MTKRFFIFFMILFHCAIVTKAFSDNQTPEISPVLPGNKLPFQIRIELADFLLPEGFHSGIVGVHDDKWLLLAGRTNGLHGFANNDDNFPPRKQNTHVFVVCPKTGQAFSRSLHDSSDLSQHEIDLLSVTSPQFYQYKKTLYMTGGYGVDTASGQFSTKDALTAIDVPGLMHWVLDTCSGGIASEHIRRTFDPFLKVTGGYMARVDKDSSLLIFGQDFQGFYKDNANGEYTQQVRRFKIIDDGKNLRVLAQKSEAPNPNYRRRDLNVVPIMTKRKGLYESSFVAFSGVFTLTTGVWTIPVSINNLGKTFMADPSDPNAFKQGMNNYVCPTVGLFSSQCDDMYTIILGGISYAYFNNETFDTDPEIPFINQVTTIKLDKKGLYTQYLMADQYPEILSTGPNRGNPLLFGAGAAFIPSDDLPVYENGVIEMDKINRGRTLLGYIVGGIVSTVPNTDFEYESTGSPYIFKVYLDKD